MADINDFGAPYQPAIEFKIEVTLGKRHATLEVWGKTEAEALECAKHTYASILAGEMLNKIKAEVKR